MKAEEKTAAFYREISAKAKNSKLKSFFEFLAHVSKFEIGRYSILKRRLGLLP